MCCCSWFGCTRTRLALAVTIGVQMKHLIVSAHAELGGGEDRDIAALHDSTFKFVSRARESQVVITLA